MREIKFRYVANGKIRGYWWIEERGTIATEEETEFALNRAKYMPFISQQYTGLKDKNGVEIYEGDVIQTYNSSGMKLSTFTVEYMPLDNCGDCTNDSGIGFNLYLNEPNKCEVIGNIY